MQVPESVHRFFRGEGGINVMVSPSFLKYHTGKPRICLQEHDIYHGGKNNKNEVVYTRYKIIGKESIHNTIQGILEVKIIEGYGVDDSVDIDVSRFMRPNDMKKLFTTGSTSIKRNSVIILESGILIRLEDIENFCDLPVIDRTRLFKSQTHVAIVKREAYKAVRGTDNWAHVKRGALARDMERSVHKLILPYYRKYRTSGDQEGFFKAFVEDLLVVCTAHHSNFVENGEFVDLIQSTISKGTKRKKPSLINETRPRKKWGHSVPTEGGSENTGDTNVDDMVKKALKNVSKSKIASLVF